VSRLARGVLPANTSIQKDATLALAKSATVFISYLAHHANEQSTKKTLGPQDVLKALKEIEMAGVMELGVVGKDGRLGGRLEREMEVYEEMVKEKRKGYRDKVKARESVGEDADGEGERGEPSSKRARRMSDEDTGEEEEEERMLEQQLNGTGMENSSSPTRKATRKRKPDSGSSPALNGKGKSVEQADSDAEVVEEEAEDEAESEVDDDDDDDDDADEQDDEEDEGDDDEGDDVDESNHTNSRERVGLMPDGNVEVGSEDESD